MDDTSNGAGRRRKPWLSIPNLLAVAWGLSLALSGYLLSRQDVRSIILEPTAVKAQAQPAEMTTQPAVVNTQSPVNSAPGEAADLDALMAQLQNMQTLLQATSAQLEQKSQADNAFPAATPTARPALFEEDIPALWAEIEQLNQIMQPLMIQLETANANRSSRSVSELAAIRTQVNTIHQRLAYLLARVEAAKARANGSAVGTGAQPGASLTGQPGNSTNPDLAAYQQLYQTMAELQALLRQMQSQGQLP